MGHLSALLIATFLGTSAQDAPQDFKKIMDHFRKAPSYRDREAYRQWQTAGKKLCDDFVGAWEAKADEGENRFLLAQVYYRYFAGRLDRRNAEKHYAKAVEHLKAFRKTQPDHTGANRLLGYVEKALARARYRSEAGAKRKALVGQPSPGIKFDEILDGKELTLAGLKGKVVVLDFWATWCGPCRRVIPHLVELQKKHGEKGLQVVGVTRFYTYGYSQGKSKRKLKPDEERQVNRECAKDLGINYPIVFSKEGAKAYWVTGIPQLVLIDRKGVVRHVQVGAGDHTELDKLIDTCVAESAGTGSEKGS